jgi:hypothetical protein
MSLGAVWIDQQSPNSRQLCFASDSRTSPGPIDGVTKVILFGRTDVAAVWAGDYRYASLILANLDAFFTSSSTIRNRDVDVAQALRSAIDPIKRHLRESVTPPVPFFNQNKPARVPEPTSIVIGGYSIKRSEFHVLAIEWPLDQHKWKISTRPLGPNEVIFIGDDRARARSHAKQARAHRDPISRTWRMEPLAAIHMAIVDPKSPTIGGVPQLAKALVHGVARPYAFLEGPSGSVRSRGATVPARGARELMAADRVIDLSLWLLDAGQYQSCRRPYF